MPAVFVETTFPLKDATALAQSLSAIVARTLNHPESHVTVSIRKSDVITRGGIPSEFAYVEVRSIGGLHMHINNTLSQQISEVLAREGIDKRHIDINFMDIEPQNWGKSQGTFGKM